MHKRLEELEGMGANPWLYNGMLLTRVESDIKLYIKSDQCRRATLLKHFEVN